MESSNAGFTSSDEARRDNNVSNTTKNQLESTELNSVQASKEGKQSLYQIFMKIFGINNDGEPPSTKEIGTLILLGSMVLLFIISATGFVVMWFTEYYNDKILSQLILSEGSEAANDWINPNYDTLLKVHVFNYTNIDEYLSGKDSKIKVVDVGPFTYKEHTTKVNLTFNNNYTVTFRDHRTYEFLSEKSVADEHATFILPNVPLLTAAVKVETLHPVKRLYAKFRINNMKEKVFKNLTAHDFLWGYRDKIVALDVFSGKSHFGLLMNRNGTSQDSLQINTGEDDIRKFSIITQFNGMALLDFWEDDECNRIDGSDASMFPPHLLENNGQLYVFLSVLCRKIPLRYEKDVILFEKIEALRYRTPLNVFSHPDENSENQCYCDNTETCLPSGVINATKCYDGAPIYPSFPHFFSGDPKIYEIFDGIKPDADIHQTYADIHPRLAFPMGGASRIQINIAVHKSPLYRKQIERLEERTILPLIWIEITTGEFTEELIDKLYMSTVGLNSIQFALKYGTLLISVTSFSLIVAIIFYLQRKYEETFSNNELKETEELATLQAPSSNIE